MRSAKIDKFLEKAIDEMFKAVGFEGFDKDFTNQKEWYLKKSWSEDQRTKFKSWFIKKATSDLNWSVSTAEKEFSYFDLSYGWTVLD
jgi:hypothetical protein